MTTMTTKEKFAEKLGIKTEDFEIPEVSKDERIKELEDALEALLDGRTD